jgi:hypothetical protein
MENKIRARTNLVRRALAGVIDTKRRRKNYFFAVGLVLAAGLFLFFQPFQKPDITNYLEAGITGFEKEIIDNGEVRQVNFQVEVECSPAFVNMYTVRVNTYVNAFEVINAEMRPANNESKVYFSVAPGQMVYFEAFSRQEFAQNAAQQRRGYRFYNPSPFKNFQHGSNLLCQTNYLNIHQPLGNNWNYACKTSLKIPCIQ